MLQSGAPAGLIKARRWGAWQGGAPIPERGPQTTLTPHKLETAVAVGRFCCSGRWFGLGCAAMSVVYGRHPLAKSDRRNPIDPNLRRKCIEMVAHIVIGGHRIGYGVC